jgi:hypothetical protein
VCLVVWLGGAASRTAVRPPGRALGAARARAEQVLEAAPDAAGRGPEAAPDPVAPADLQGADGLDQSLFWARLGSRGPGSGTRAADWLGGAASRTAAPETVGRGPEPAPDLGAVLYAAGRGPVVAPDPVAPAGLQGADGLDQSLFWARLGSRRPGSGNGAVARLGGAASRTAVRPPGPTLRAARAEQEPETAEQAPEAAPVPLVADLESGAQDTHRERYRSQGNPNPEQTRPHGVLAGLREIAGAAVLPAALQAIVLHSSSGSVSGQQYGSSRAE